MTQDNVRGRFITLEGGDGAGKSTQARLLIDYLHKKGIKAVATREVGGCDGAETIRGMWLDKPQGYWDPLTEVLLIMAARREHLVRTIWPALQSGIWVVSDRFVDSTRVYQGIGQGLGLPKIDQLYQEIAGDFWPDLTFYLDVPVEVGHARRAARQGLGDRFEEREAAFHEKLRAAFLDLCRAEDQRFRVIDASCSPDDVASSITAQMDNYVRLVG